MAGVFQPNVFQNNVFQVGARGGGNSKTKIAADDDVYNRKIKTAVAAEKKKKRLAAEAARKARAEAKALAKAQEQFAESAQVPVLADPFDYLTPTIDPNGPVPPVHPMPDVRAPMPPQSFLQDQKDQQDVMDIIALLAKNPETARLLASA